jgi:pimeloyl-ACP methyl ester carboxylesterase
VKLVIPPVILKVCASPDKGLCVGLLLLLAATQAAASECVILLHGMGRSHDSMNVIEQALIVDDYQVVNIDYPSTDYSIEQLASQYIPQAIKHCETIGSRKIHFVTHSLGGILVRYFLQDHRIEGLGKIVMLSPPNHGSEVADTLTGWKPYYWVMGPPGQQLRTGKNDIPKSLKPIPGAIGIITGNVSYDPWFSVILPGEDDGKVSAESAKLAEMADFMVVDSSHAFIMKSDKVIRQILYFLKNSHFDRSI